MADFVLLTLLIVVIASISIVSKSKENTGFWICIIIFTFLAGFRASFVGNDTEEYLRIFKEVDSNNYDFSTSRYEIGYLIFNKLISLFCNNGQVVFIVSGAFIYYSVGRFILKYSRMPLLSLLLFLTYGYFSSSMNILRQFIAISILLYSFSYILKGRFVKFLLIVILASLFHTTSFLFIFAYLARYVKPSLKSFLICILLAIIGSYAFNILLGEMLSIFNAYQHYDGGKYFGDTRAASILYVIISSLVLLLSFILLKGKSKNGNHSISDFNYEINCELILVLFGVCLYILSLKLNILDRIAIYYNIFSIVLLPNAIKCLRPDCRFMFSVITVFLFFSYTITIIVVRPEWNSAFPYSFCF